MLLDLLPQGIGCMGCQRRQDPPGVSLMQNEQKPFVILIRRMEKLAVPDQYIFSLRYAPFELTFPCDESAILPFDPPRIALSAGRRTSLPTRAVLPESTA